MGEMAQTFISEIRDVPDTGIRYPVKSRYPVVFGKTLEKLV